MNMLYQRGTVYMMPGHQWNNSLQVNRKQITAYIYISIETTVYKKKCFMTTFHRKRLSSSILPEGHGYLFVNDDVDGQAYPASQSVQLVLPPRE